MVTLQNINWEEPAAMFNWLADVFYQQPTAEKLEFAKNNLIFWPESNAEVDSYIKMIKKSIEIDGVINISKDFHRLFVGPGSKEVYPWGSVYTEEDKLLFGPSTILWEEFCEKNKIVIKLDSNEPTDHFALFFYSLSAVMKSEHSVSKKNAILSEIIFEHFLPWGERVLNLIGEKASTNYYRGFSLMASYLVRKWCFGLREYG